MSNTRFSDTIGGGGSPSVNPTDSFAVNIVAPDTNALPTDVFTAAIAITQNDPNNTPTETASLNLQGLGDTNSTPTEVRTVVVRSFSTGSTSNDANQPSPGNVDNQNDGVFCTIKTNNALGDLTNPVSVNTGSMNFPGGTVTSALIRVWFKVPARTTALDTITITATSSGGFSGTVYTHSGTAAVDHSTTALSLTFDISSLTNTQLTNLVLHGNYQAAVVATPETSLQIDSWSIDATETI